MHPYLGFMVLHGISRNTPPASSLLPPKHRYQELFPSSALCIEASPGVTKLHSPVTSTYHWPLPAEEEFSSADWTAHEIQSQRAQAGPARHAGEKFIDGGEPG